MTSSKFVEIGARVRFCGWQMIRLEGLSDTHSNDAEASQTIPHPLPQNQPDPNTMFTWVVSEYLIFCSFAIGGVRTQLVPSLQVELLHNFC